MAQIARPEPLRGLHDIWRTLVAVGLLEVLAGVVVLAYPDLGLRAGAVLAGILVRARQE